MALLVDYSVKENSFKELRESATPDAQIFTGLEFFSNTGFTVASYLESYFKTAIPASDIEFTDDSPGPMFQDYCDTGRQSQ